MRARAGFAVDSKGTAVELFETYGAARFLSNEMFRSALDEISASYERTLGSIERTLAAFK